MLAAAWLDATLLEVKLLERTELLIASALEILLSAALLLAGMELPRTTMTTLEAVELLDVDAFREENIELAADMAALLAALLLAMGPGEVDKSVAVITENLPLASPIVSMASAAALGVDGALTLTRTI